PAGPPSGWLVALSGGGGAWKSQARAWHRDVRGRSAEKRALSTFLFAECGAHHHGAARIHGALALLDVLDRALLVHQKCGAVRELVFSVEHAVEFDDLARHVAQQRERHADLLREFCVGEWAVDADAEHLRIRRVELGDISLICLE